MERRHVCGECGKSFRRKDHLQDHSTTHLTHRPYSCDLCDYACNRKDRLQAHLLSHTGEITFKVYILLVKLVC